MKQALQQEDLIDKKAALSRIGNDENHYNELLAVYADSASELVKQIGESFWSRDYNSAVQFTHTLESSSRAIGAYQSGNLSNQLRIALQNRNVFLIESSFLDLVTHQKQLFSELKVMLRDKTTVPKTHEANVMSMS